MELPNLSSLSLGESTRDAWLRACGTRPAFKSWKQLSGAEKYKMLHAVALEADDGKINYLTPYLEMDIDDVVQRRVWSVEHTVPRSHAHAAKGAKDDPNGWIVATRRSNSRRGNLPLVLWPTDEDVLPNSIEIIRGEAHFVPPLEQRATLARKWLFLRATYPGIKAPSEAQRDHANDIIELAKMSPILKAQWRVNASYRETYGWANPLLEEGAEKWYDDPGWKKLVFSSVFFNY